MTDVSTENRLVQLLRNIANDHGYDTDNINVKPISSGGANYTSELFSSTLLSSGKDELQLFSKAATLSKKVRSMCDTQVYEIEDIFYTKILPKFRDLEDKYNIPEADRLVVPKYYGGVVDYGNELIVLEDLTGKGFKSFDRSKCFDWNYASASVEMLAKFHALSVGFERDDPEKYAEIISKLKFKFPRETKDFVNKNNVTAIGITDEIYRERVELFLKNEIRKETFAKFFNSERKIVLTHGDFRPSNILQKVDEDGKLLLALVDYQFIRQGNPVTDLVYFFISGSDEEFRAKYLHQYFDHYYETFSQSLQRLGIDPDTVYTENDFRDDVKEMLPFGLTLATFCLLFITVGEDDAPLPGDELRFDDLDLEVSEQYEERFNALVRDYVKLGII